MANNFQIQISAVDKASAVFRKVNGAVNQLTRPFEQVGQSFKSLGKELGFQRLGKNLGQIGREAKGAASGVASIVAPMAAVTGIGSVAGIIALADGWARLGRSTANTAGNIGVNADELQKFQGAAKLAGLSSEDMASSLQGLSSTMENAQFGRDNQALMLFNSLTGGMKRTASGALDVTGEFKAMASAIAKLDTPQKQMLAAQKFGMQALLPLIRQGPGAFQALQDRAEALGLVMSGSALRAATDFANSLDNLHGAGTGLKNSIVEQITPAIKPLVDGLADWIMQNRTLIAQDVGAWAKDFATWVNSVDWKGVGSGIHDFVKGIGNVVHHLGGWKNAAIAVAVVMNATLIGSVLGLGLTLVRGAAGIVSFTGLLLGWKAAAVEAGAATDLANAAASRGLLGGIGAGAAALATGAAAMFYSPTLNDGEDQEVARLRKAQGLPEVESQTPDQSMRERATADAWKKNQGADQDAASFAMDYFQSKGWSKAAAAGIVGNGIAESNLDPKAKGDWGLTGPTARGIFQLHPDRQKNFENWAGFKITDERADRMKQLEFANYELTEGTESKAGARLRSAKNAEDAGEIASRSWLRPGADDEAKAREAATRGAMADQLAPPGPISTAKNEPQRHAFDVTFSGLPAGVSAKTRSATGADVTTKIGHSAVGGGP
jgi:hypothetical protein